jgi:hypothetical protein
MRNNRHTPSSDWHPNKRSFEMKFLKAIKKLCLTLGILWSCLAIVAKAPAELYMEDTFDYPTGAIDGRDGGVGFSGSWSALQNFTVDGASTVEEGSLALSNFPTSGNRVRMANNSSSDVGSPNRKYISLSRNAGVDILSGDLWIAYLYKRIDTNGASDAWVELRNNSCFCLGMTSKAGTEFFNTSTNGLGIANRYDSTPSTPDQSANIQNGNTYLLVGRFTNIGTTSSSRSATIWALSAADYDAIKGDSITAAELDANHRSMSVDTSIDATMSRILLNHIMRWVNGVKFSGANLDHYDPMIFDFDELRYGSSLEDVVLPPAGIGGDFNQNNVVDAADYVTWRKNDLANASLPNDNGLTTQADRYALWRANFGQGTQTGAGSSLGNGAAVPEPSACLLAVFGSLLLAGVRPRKR